MKCVVVSPEKTVLTMESKFTVLPLIDGECGILPGHAPLIARLGAGELRITGMDDQQTNLYIEGGFAEVLDDTIALLSMLVMPVAELDLVRAESQLEEALARPSHTPELARIREEKLYSRRARVRVAQKHQR